MSKLVAALPLVGFFLALTAFWCWSKAKEAGIDADLQKRLWNHSKYQRDFGEQTPLEVSEWLARERTKFTWLAAVLAVLALGCFAYTLANLDSLR